MVLKYWDSWIDQDVHSKYKWLKCLHSKEKAEVILDKSVLTQNKSKMAWM